jgi:type III secretory pathway component EscV
VLDKLERNKFLLIECVFKIGFLMLFPLPESITSLIVEILCLLGIIFMVAMYFVKVFILKTNKKKVKLNYEEDF